MNKPFAWRKRWSRRILPILLVAWGLVSGCRADGPPDATAALPYAVEVVAEGLEAPWALAVAPDGRLFVTERPGRIRVIAEGKLMPEPLLSFSSPFVSEGEGGLLGIAVDPDFAHNGYLYVYHTYRAGEEVKNRVLRLAVRGNRAAVDRVLLDGIPGAVHHNGGRIHIGPDGCLYITTGDALRPELAQDLDSLAGKILRIHRDGSIPEDNPFPGSPVYSWGHRNPQGLAWHPVTGALYSSEHGPSARDELNRIEPGANYGWPLVTGDETRAAPVEAAYRGTPVLWPGDVALASQRHHHVDPLGDDVCHARALGRAAARDQPARRAGAESGRRRKRFSGCPAGHRLVSPPVRAHSRRGGGARRCFVSAYLL